MQNPKRILKLWYPPLSWALIIFILSSFPTVETTEIYWQDFVLKKTAHIIEYGIFATLFYRALINSGIERKKAGLWAIFISLLYGITDEYHQSFVPGREPRIRDLVFDTIGAYLAIYIIWRYLPKAPKKLKDWAERVNLLL